MLQFLAMNVSSKSFLKDKMSSILLGDVFYKSLFLRAVSSCSESINRPRHCHHIHKQSCLYNVCAPDQGTLWGRSLVGWGYGPGLGLKTVWLNLGVIRKYLQPNHMTRSRRWSGDVEPWRQRLWDRKNFIWRLDFEKVIGLQRTVSRSYWEENHISFKRRYFN